MREFNSADHYAATKVLDSERLRPNGGEMPAGETRPALGWRDHDGSRDADRCDSAALPHLLLHRPPGLMSEHRSPPAPAATQTHPTASGTAHTFLGRLTEAVRQQNWFAVALELVIVVVGVVVGFQVTAWGNARAARAEEQELLRGLRAEFEEVLSGLQLQVEKHQRVEHAVATILDALGEAEAAGAASAGIGDTTLAWALVPTTTQFSQGVLDGLLTTGRLTLIRDPELRTALAEWEGVLADVVEDEVASREIVMTQLEPLLWRVMDVRALRDYDLLADHAPSATLEATSDVPVHSELFGVLSTRRFWLRHTISEFAAPREEAKVILELIERSLEGATR